VLTFSLAGERSSGQRSPRQGHFDRFADQIDRVLDARGIPAAMICGVSFGGLAALHFAATRPQRTAGLVLVSTPAPGWHLRRRHEWYARVPWLFGPVFFAEAPWRMRAEIRAALPDAAARRRFTRQQIRTFVTAPLSVSRMASRARIIGQFDAAAICRSIACPTLVLTGEPGLDHVINGDGGSAYAQLIPSARRDVLSQTGHLGLVTKPEAFAAAIQSFFQTFDGGSEGTAHDAA
jgi:pimeloyl-ACP methyl ester carboxylesterase